LSKSSNKRVIHPTRNELRDKLTTIKHSENKLVLSLLLNYDNVLQSDLALVKMANYKDDEPHYKDGIIYFPRILKTNHKNIKIELTAEDILLVESTASTTDYLIGSILSQDRSNTFSKYVKRISKKYLNYSITITCYRKIIERQLLSELNINDEWIDKYNKLKLEVGKRGHDVQTVLQYYK
jgi:hypothetical protein